MEANVPLFQVPYYLAELTEKIAENGRIKVLEASQAKLKELISFCEIMELVREEEMETSKQGGANTFADCRAKKIARFKRQRAAESKLLELKERKERRGRSTKASALSTPVETGEDDVLDGDGEEEHPCTSYNHASVLLAYLYHPSTALQAFDLLEMLNKEEEMLSAIKEKQLQDGEKEFSQLVLDECTKKVETWHRDDAARAHYTKPVAPITCATFAQDVIEGRVQVSQAHEHKHQPLLFRPASLVGRNPTTEREKIAAQVFSLIIEEAGLTEMNMMNEWQERTVKLMEEANSSWHRDAPKSRPAEEDEEEDGAAQDKARAWDDWKDDNPRGAGNKKLTPCS
ncbi:hypothetical protein RND71_004452 [Anisodus tanguticus]|uniref:PP2A regulatory subunit TAP46 n=1 Tax=Anisodus tanguticus TaxID=243964 RepID=A0AAE1SQ44_9SOLA|nr:hypothetical protein RND71_004452 [Anisodus tanguticus]